MLIWGTLFCDMTSTFGAVTALQCDDTLFYKRSRYDQNVSFYLNKNDHTCRISPLDLSIAAANMSTSNPQRWRWCPTIWTSNSIFFPGHLSGLQVYCHKTNYIAFRLSADTGNPPHGRSIVTQLVEIMCNRSAGQGSCLQKDWTSRSLPCRFKNTGNLIRRCDLLWAIYSFYIGNFKLQQSWILCDGWPILMFHSNWKDRSQKPAGG